MSSDRRRRASSCLSITGEEPAYSDLHLCDEHIAEIPSQYLTQRFLYDPAVITRLDLSRNNFMYLNGIANFVNLVSLDVSSNSLVELPDDIANCQKLRSLVARNNLLEDLPKTLHHLRGLDVLNLSGNRLTTFPEQIILMPTIRVLYLGANGIQRIPFEIGAMIGLEILYLGGNGLSEIPVTIGALKNLINLTLCDNQLEFIPSSVAELTNLESLSLHNNQIRTLPTEIVQLRNLQQLSLRNNPLVHSFVHNMSYDPPALKELAGRTVRRRISMNALPFPIPNDLRGYLKSASQCVNPKCKGVYFEACVEHVKFVDFCGKYRVPLLQFLCSGKCARRASSTDASDPSSSSDSAESEDEIVEDESAEDISEFDDPIPEPSLDIRVPLDLPSLPRLPSDGFRLKKVLIG